MEWWGKKGVALSCYFFLDTLGASACAEKVHLSVHISNIKSKKIKNDQTSFPKMEILHKNVAVTITDETKPRSLTKKSSRSSTSIKQAPVLSKIIPWPLA